MEHERPSLHVVLGAGQIGSRLPRLLLARGHRVRTVRKGGRGDAAPVTANHEWLEGDMADLDFAERATRGAAVVYDCMNPPYHQWPEHLVAMGRGALHGAAKAGAKLVALDCLYMYGRPSGPMSELSPYAPCSKKGTLRVELSELRLGAHGRGDVRVAIARASDFFGENLPYSTFNERFFDRILAGTPGECMGDPEMPHSYTYANDVARALVLLGEHDEAMGQVWHIPTNPAESSRLLTRRMGRALGLDADMVGIPRMALRAMGTWNPFVRELVEMTYQWEVPFEIDDSRFRSTFRFEPTPIDEAVANIAAWVKSSPPWKTRPW
ncbi:NAD-dependent epimerase/dehydratase family protein [Pendulispora brunnea]|uniref:NAD-dependent epimerase/dehydratase family protein n=1 Tax=Pendulispora brunnea TaxID=2905690 RepID=A0ABZ2JXS6_9BACT